MNPLEKRICERISAEGPITFETFMDMALYEPGLGYYASENIEIGRAGDFYTSQHVHPAFGIMIARQLEEMWDSMGRPAAFFAVEPGAGAALMCRDILSYLTDKDLFRALTYVIVEANPAVRRKQEALLAGFSGKVAWRASLHEVGKRIGCLLSNELLDAFPVHLVRMEDDLAEVYVDFDRHGSGENVRFVEVTRPPSTAALSEYLSEFAPRLPKGYRTEINLRIKDWLKSVSDVLDEGFVLTIDYGYPSREYYDAERNRGTLLCYSGHRTEENPLVKVGRQDITAHVNFSAVKRWGELFGLKAIGFCRQGTYLVSLGIDRLIRELYERSPEYLFEVSRIKRLIFPGTLGDTHKVIVQYKGKGNPQLRGFMVKNEIEKL